jgi:translation initiation factor IF-3
MSKHGFGPSEDEIQNRVNWQIRCPQVRVVKDEEQLGIMTTDQARKIAQDAGLDLVEIAPQARPPVCRIMDYSRFKYEQRIKKKEVAKKQRASKIQFKELRLRPCIAEHDADIKISQAKKFIEEGFKVQFILQFRGQRQLAHREQGFAVMTRILDAMKDVCNVEKSPKMEGNKIICCLSPKV